MCTWAPRARIEAAAQRAFPHAIKVGKFLVLSNDPLPVDIDAWLSRLRSERVTDYLGEAPVRSIEPLLESAVLAAPFNPAHEFNEDLQPRDEFVRPRRRR
jgi:hypothetical protein